MRFAGYLSRGFARTNRQLEAGFEEVHELTARTIEQERRAANEAAGRLVPAADNRPKTEELEPGDVVLVTSNGLAEIADGHDQPFGYDRIRRRFGEPARQEPEAVADALLDSAAQHLGGAEPQDDITIVVVRAR